MYIHTHTYNTIYMPLGRPIRHGRPAWIFMNSQVYIYSHVHVCMYIYTCTHTYVTCVGWLETGAFFFHVTIFFLFMSYMLRHTYVHIHILTYSYVYLCNIYTYICMYVWILYIPMYTYVICMYIYMCIYIWILMYSHVYVLTYARM